MYSLKTIDEFIYNNNRDIALKFTSNTVFAGSYFHMSNMYTYFEVWLLQSPHCKLQTKTAEYTLYQGDVLIFSKSDDKEVISSNTNALFLKLQIDANAFAKILPLVPFLENSKFFSSHSENFNNRIPASYPAAKHIRDAFAEMINIFDIKQSGYELEILKAGLDIILTILRETNYSAVSQSVTPEKIINKSNMSLKKAIDYIDSHITEELTLEKISSIAELSPNYLSNIFRELTGVRLWDYIGERRIRLATQLLIENPNDSIISIALKCGFNNCPNFNRAFKKYTGQTPMKYKISILRQED